MEKRNVNNKKIKIKELTLILKNKSDCKYIRLKNRPHLDKKVSSRCVYLLNQDEPHRKLFFLIKTFPKIKCLYFYRNISDEEALFFF